MKINTPYADLNLYLNPVVENECIVLADLTVMKKFLVIQAIEHDKFYDYDKQKDCL